MKRIISLFFAILPILVSAQEILSEDTTTQQYAEAHIIASFVKSFNHGLFLTVEEEIRTAPAHRSHTTVSLGYSPVKYLSLSAAYVLKLYGDQGWSDVNKFLRHRVNLDVTGQVSFGQWKLSLRERLMMDARADEINLLEKNKVDLVLRSRVQAQYSIPNQPLSLIAKMEVFNTLNAKYFGQYINELRPELGLQWKVDKHNSLTLAYRYNYVYSRSIDMLDSGNVSLEHEYKHKHILLLTYKFGW